MSFNASKLITDLSAKPISESMDFRCASLNPTYALSKSPSMSPMLRISPALSKTVTLYFLNALVFSNALRCSSRKTIANCVPPSSALIPWSAKAASTATPSSMSMPTDFIAGPALLVKAIENCSTEALASVFAFTSTSDTRTMLFMLAIASLRIVKPKADCASVSKSVARAMSNMPACANLATLGKADTDASADKPADAR